MGSGLRPREVGDDHNGAPLRIGLCQRSIFSSRKQTLAWLDWQPSSL